MVGPHTGLLLYWYIVLLSVWPLFTVTVSGAGNILLPGMLLYLDQHLHTAAAKQGWLLSNKSGPGFLPWLDYSGQHGTNCRKTICGKSPNDKDTHKKHKPAFVPVNRTANSAGSYVLGPFRYYVQTRHNFVREIRIFVQ